MQVTEILYCVEMLCNIDCAPNAKSCNIGHFGAATFRLQISVARYRYNLQPSSGETLESIHISSQPKKKAYQLCAMFVQDSFC